MMARQPHNVGNSPLKGATPADGSMTLQLTRLLSRFLAVGVLTSPATVATVRVVSPTEVNITCDCGGQYH